MQIKLYKVLYQNLVSYTSVASLAACNSAGVQSLLIIPSPSVVHILLKKPEIASQFPHAHCPI